MDAIGEASSYRGPIAPKPRYRGYAFKRPTTAAFILSDSSDSEGQALRSPPKVQRKRRAVAPTPSTQSSTASGSKVHLTRDDYRIIVSWVEVDENRDAVFGRASKTLVDGATTTKIKAFGRLAAHLNRVSKNTKLPTLDAGAMKNRWGTYHKKFKAVLAQSIHQTGMGLTDAEISKGISVQDKLNRLCPHFARMNAMFGTKTNVAAAATLELGVPQLQDEDVAPPLETLRSSTPISVSGGSSSDDSDLGELEEKRANNDLEFDDEFAFLDNLRDGGDEGSIGAELLSLAQTELHDDNERSPRPDLSKRPAQGMASNTKKPRSTSTSVAKKAKSTKYDDKEAKHHAPPRLTHHESRVSLAHAYVENNNQIYDFLHRKIEQDDRHWREERREEKDRIQREKMERDAAFRQSIVLELVKQGKTPDQIRDYLAVLDA